MRKTENLIYLSQIDHRDIFLYAEDTLRAFEWLIENGYAIQSWEAFLETKNGIARTLNLGNKTDSPFRCCGMDAEVIRNDIVAAIEDWSGKSKGMPLIINLNLKTMFWGRTELTF